MASGALYKTLVCEPAILRLSLLSSPRFWCPAAAATLFLASSASRRRCDLVPRLQRPPASSAFFPAADKPPRARSSSGYHDVRTHPASMYYAEIRSGNTRLGLETFETAHKAARAYDTAVWRLLRPRSQMNFSDAQTSQQAQDLVPPPRLITDEDRCI